MNSTGARFASILTAAVLAAAQAQTATAEYEEAPRVIPEHVLPPTLLSSGNHRVRGDVKTKGNWLEFEIESDFGTYKALSIPMVALRVHEIRTLAQAVDEFRRGNEEFADTLRGQLTVGAESFVDILASPLATGSRIVTQFGINVARTFEELRDLSPAKHEPESFYHQFEPGDPILAAHKRNVASQLDLDVYSSNLKVQEFLEAVAAARSSGRQSAGLAIISLPRDHEARVADGRVDSAVRAAMTHNTINQLYARNFQRLASAGVEEDPAHAFLSHPIMSPWHKTGITEYAAFLDGVEDRGALLRAAQTARSEEEALAYLQVAKMLAALTQRSVPIRGLVQAGPVVLATTRDGRILVMLPFDRLFWNRETDRVFSGLARFAQDKGFKARTVVCAGVITEQARRRLGDLGFELEERFLARR